MLELENTSSVLVKRDRVDVDVDVDVDGKVGYKPLGCSLRIIEGTDPIEIQHHHQKQLFNQWSVDFAGELYMGWLKPKLADYEIEALLPRPRKNIQDKQDEDEEENSVHGSQSGSELADD
ncbi:hypothetical protein B0H14DRAFT_2619264 [Mycena olivaceomarginata]|nr:hypothetical protein B0H14DRAFT_2619264 [Mycena olivaceomarginata]